MASEFIEKVLEAIRQIRTRGATDKSAWAARARSRSQRPLKTALPLAGQAQASQQAGAELPAGRDRRHQESSGPAAHQDGVRLQVMVDLPTPFWLKTTSGMGTPGAGWETHPSGAHQGNPSDARKRQRHRRSAEPLWFSRHGTIAPPATGAPPRACHRFFSLGTGSSGPPAP